VLIWQKALEKVTFKAGVLLVLNLYGSSLYLLVLISCIVDDDDNYDDNNNNNNNNNNSNTAFLGLSIVQITDLRHFRRRLRLVS